MFPNFAKQFSEAEKIEIWSLRLGKVGGLFLFLPVDFLTIITELKIFSEMLF